MRRLSEFLWGLVGFLWLGLFPALVHAKSKILSSAFPDDAYLVALRSGEDVYLNCAAHMAGKEARREGKGRPTPICLAGSGAHSLQARDSLESVDWLPGELGAALGGILLSCDSTGGVNGPLRAPTIVFPTLDEREHAALLPWIHFEGCPTAATIAAFMPGVASFFEHLAWNREALIDTVDVVQKACPLKDVTQNSPVGPIRDASCTAKRGEMGLMLTSGSLVGLTQSFHVFGLAFTFGLTDHFEGTIRRFVFAAARRAAQKAGDTTGAATGVDSLIADSIADYDDDSEDAIATADIASTCDDPEADLDKVDAGYACHLGGDGNKALKKLHPTMGAVWEIDGKVWDTGQTAASYPDARDTCTRMGAHLPTAEELRNLTLSTLDALYPLRAHGRTTMIWCHHDRLTEGTDEACSFDTERGSYGLENKRRHDITVRCVAD